MVIAHPFRNRLLFALRLRPEFFLGIGFGSRWITVKPTSYQLFSERYGSTWSKILGACQLSVRRRD